MNRDRGRIKWTSLMLPEHVNQLRAWQQEENVRERVEPDEQQLEEWNYKITSAMELNKPLCITYWNNSLQLREIGFVQYLDYALNTLRFMTDEGVARIIKFIDIENV